MNSPSASALASPRGVSPVSISIRRHVPAGTETAAEQALQGVIETAQRFAGYEGSQVLRQAAGDWQLIVRFDQELNLQRWQEDPATLQWIAHANAALPTPAQVERVNGLEAWFTLPNRVEVAPPPKWKTAIVSALGIYPITLGLPLVLGPLLKPLPSWLSGLVMVAFLVPLMTWGVMPALTRLFKPWLYPGAK